MDFDNVENALAETTSAFPVKAVVVGTLAALATAGVTYGVRQYLLKRKHSTVEIVPTEPENFVPANK